MTGGKARSRVALEAEEKRVKARELDRRIRELHRQIERPRSIPAPRAASAEGEGISSLRRLLRFSKSADDERRLPLVNERRRHRNRTILWAMAGFIAFFWALGKLWSILR